MNVSTEKLGFITCPMCAGHENLQLEEAAIYIRPITVGVKPPYPNCDDGEVHWSNDLKEPDRSVFKDGSGTRIACFSDICKGYKWTPPKWVIKQLWENYDTETIGEESNG